MPAGLEPLSDASGEATEQELNIGDAASPRLSLYIYLQVWFKQITASLCIRGSPDWKKWLFVPKSLVLIDCNEVPQR